MQILKVVFKFLMFIGFWVVTKNNSFRLWHVATNAKTKERVAQTPKADSALTSSTPEGFIFGRQKGSFVRKAVTMDAYIYLYQIKCDKIIHIHLDNFY